LLICPSVHLFICSSVHLFICSSVHLFICLSVYLFICLSVYLFICSSIHLFICSSVHLFICSSIHLFICSSVRLFICSSSIHLDYPHSSYDALPRSALYPDTVFLSTNTYSHRHNISSAPWRTCYPIPSTHSFFSYESTMYPVIHQSNGIITTNPPPPRDTHQPSTNIRYPLLTQHKRPDPRGLIETFSFLLHPSNPSDNEW
jgi:hypothetical protein